MHALHFVDSGACALGWKGLPIIVIEYAPNFPHGDPSNLPQRHLESMGCIAGSHLHCTVELDPYRECSRFFLREGRGEHL